MTQMQIMTSFSGWRRHPRASRARSERQHCKWGNFSRGRLFGSNSNSWLFKTNERLFNKTCRIGCFISFKNFGKKRPNVQPWKLITENRWSFLKLLQLNSQINATEIVFTYCTTIFSLLFWYFQLKFSFILPLIPPLWRNIPYNQWRHGLTIVFITRKNDLKSSMCLFLC